MVWIILADAITALQALCGGDEIVDQFFNNPKALVVANPGTSGYVPPQATRTANYKSVMTYQGVPGLEAGAPGLPDGYEAVLLDLESWGATPPAEQQAPAKFYDDAAAFLRSLPRDPPFKLVSTPGTDLFPGWEAFVASQLAAACGKVSYVYDVQAQDVWNDGYVDYVTQAARQARGANQGLLVVAGLSTRPATAPPPTAKQLYDLVFATRQYVDGYWLNVPTGAPVEPALELLQMLSPARGPQPLGAGATPCPE
jgi:hypothetical protein